MAELPVSQAGVAGAHKPTVSGLVYMVASCFSFAAMVVFVYAVHLAEPEASSLVTSFARIVVNLVVLVIWALVTRDVKDLIGDMRPSLWWRGAFGSCALVLSFLAVKTIGAGEAQFLASSNGVFVALLAPWVLKQKNSARVWVAIAGSLVGLYLLFQPRLLDAAPWGRGIALFSGFLSAMAYLMIARAGRSNSANSVIFYLCIVAIALHAVLFAVVGASWPTEPMSYLLLLFVGLFGSLGQLFLTKAYQSSPAAMNSAVSYLQPVISMGFGVLFFSQVPDQRALLGAAVVLGFGVALPFLRFKG